MYLDCQESKRRKTMTTKEGTNTYRTTAIVVGVVYLAGFVVGLVGNGLIQSILGATDHLSTVSANSMMLAIGAILWLMAVAGDAAHGVLMFPVLKQHSERIAFGYLASRIVDAVFIAVSVLFMLLQIPLGSEYLKAVVPNTFYLQALSTLSMQAHLYAYDIGMIALGLAVLGLFGYAMCCFGVLWEVMGSGLGVVSSIPGGLWEVVMGVWLIAKGFN